MGHTRRCVLVSLLGGVIATVLTMLSVYAEERGEQVVIVCNERDPESRPLAEYYAQQRHVPTNRICVIRSRPVETITRREFNDDIREPILQFLSRHGLLTQEPRVVDNHPRLETTACRISYLVLIYGVPLRIEADATIEEKNFTAKLPPEFHRNEASVDSELALLPVQGLPISGPLRNPFFKSTSAFASPMNCRLLLVGRLDAPDANTVRRMMDDVLLAERYGLHGRAYFDMRGIQEKGYMEGDTWIKGAFEALSMAGYECELDGRPELFEEDYPMSDVAVYAGWYAANMTGPFTRPDFHFQTGAIAYHIHSTSAASIRTRVAGWVGPVLSKGAAASMGSVFEPYLTFTPHVDLFWRRLLDGWTFLEAAYAADPALSWQTTYVGDPLYRPFALSLDEQLLRLDADKRPELEWAWLRKINLLVRDGKPAEAARLCQEKADALRSAVLFEKLGDIESSHDAIASYRQALEHNVQAYIRIRLTMKLARTHELGGEPVRALALYEELSTTCASHKNAVEFYKKARDLAEMVGDKTKAQQWQAKIDDRLQAEHPRKN